MQQDAITYFHIVSHSIDGCVATNCLKRRGPVKSGEDIIRYCVALRLSSVAMASQRQRRNSLQIMMAHFKGIDEDTPLVERVICISFLGLLLDFVMVLLSVSHGYLLSSDHQIFTTYLIELCLSFIIFVVGHHGARYRSTSGIYWYIIMNSLYAFVNGFATYNFYHSGGTTITTTTTTTTTAAAAATTAITNSTASAVTAAIMDVTCFLSLKDVCLPTESTLRRAHLVNVAGGFILNYAAIGCGSSLRKSLLGIANTQGQGRAGDNKDANKDQADALPEVI